MLAQTPEQSKTSKPVVGKPTIVTVRPLENEPLMDLEILWFMQHMLWPEASMDQRLRSVDQYYTPLTQAEINELIAFWQARRLKTPYIEDVFDCDDFALEFFYLSHVWCVERARGHSFTPAVGQAFIKISGWYELMREPILVPRAYHVINVILRDDGQWFFFEPQGGKLMPIESHLYEGSVEVVKIHI